MEELYLSHTYQGRMTDKSHVDMRHYHKKLGQNEQEGAIWHDDNTQLEQSPTLLTISRGQFNVGLKTRLVHFTDLFDQTAIRTDSI